MIINLSIRSTRLVDPEKLNVKLGLTHDEMIYVPPSNEWVLTGALKINYYGPSLIAQLTEGNENRLAVSFRGSRRSRFMVLGNVCAVGEGKLIWSNPEPIAQIFDASGDGVFAAGVWEIPPQGLFVFTNGDFGHGVGFWHVTPSGVEELSWPEWRAMQEGENAQ